MIGEGRDRPATGRFFPGPEEESLLAALDDLEGDLDRFDPDAIRGRAREFDRPVFLARIARVLREEGVEVAAPACTLRETARAGEIRSAPSRVGSVSEAS